MNADIAFALIIISVIGLVLLAAHKPKQTPSDLLKCEITSAVEAGIRKYWVRLVYSDRPDNAMPWDSGYQEIYHTHIKERAEFVKAEWDSFLSRTGINK